MLFMITSSTKSLTNGIYAELYKSDEKFNLLFVHNVPFYIRRFAHGF